MTDETSKPRSVSFRPERVFTSAPAPANLDTWTINDIRIGNVNMFAHLTRWQRFRMRLGRAWRRVTWWWPRKPPLRRFI